MQINNNELKQINVDVYGFNIATAFPDMAPP